MFWIALKELLYMVLDLIKFPLNVLTGDVVVLRKPISEIDPWIAITQKVNGRRVRFDWVCKNEEDVWEGIERYDIWDKVNIIAVVKGEVVRWDHATRAVLRNYGYVLDVLFCFY